MSITTRKGDSGETRLLFNRPVRKSALRVAAYGEIDTLTSVMGIARAHARNGIEKDEIQNLQKILFTIGAHLALDPADRERFETSRFEKLTPKHLAQIDQKVAELEDNGVGWKGFTLPGETLYSAHLHHARALCRSCERLVWRLHDEVAPVEPLLTQILNRLADLLWLYATRDEIWHAKS